MAAYNDYLSVGFQAQYTGLATSVTYAVTDSSNVVRIAATGTGVVESTVAPGNYYVVAALDTAWMPVRVEWQITGQGVGAIETLRLTSGLVIVAGYTAGANPLSLMSSSGTPFAVDSLGRVTIGSNSDKAGYALAVTGLDAISVADVISVADAKSTFPKLVRALFNARYNEVDQTATVQSVKTDTGTVWATMLTSDNGTTTVKGAAS